MYFVRSNDQFIRFDSNRMDRSVSSALDALRGNVNRLFVNKEPWQVATMTATTVLTAVWLWEFVNQDESKQFHIEIQNEFASNNIFSLAKVFCSDRRNVSFV